MTEAMATRATHYRFANAAVPTSIGSPLPPIPTNMSVLQPTSSSPLLPPDATTPSGWNRFCHWVAAARSHRVICLVAGIWMLNGFDLAFTLLSHQHGLLDEQNPFARSMLEQGELSVLLFKVGLVLIGSYPLLRFRHVRITELGALVVLFVYALLAFRWSACFELYSASISNPISLAELEAAGVLIGK